MLKNYSIFTVIVSLTTTTVIAAGFDCKKAKSEVEKSICRNPSLSALDDSLTDYYKKIISREKDDLREKFKSEQTAWLRDRNSSCEKSERRESCLYKIYETRLADLRIEYDKPFFPPSGQTKAMCEKIADLDKAGRTSFGDGNNIKDINNDGVDEIAKSCSGGTMHAPCVEYKNQSGEIIDIKSIYFEWNDYATFGLRAFQQDGRVFRLHSFDDNFQKLAYLSYVTPDNNEYVLCEFENKASEKFVSRSQDGDEVALCDNLQKDAQTAQINKVDFNEASALKYEDLQRARRFETAAGGIATLDYDNDGAPNSVVELQYASGAGRGCDYNYFDELTEDRLGFVESTARGLLLQMQDVKLDNRHPNCGGMINRFFKYNGKAYYEKNIENDHKIIRIENSRTKVICSTELFYKTRLKKAGLIKNH